MMMIQYVVFLDIYVYIGFRFRFRFTHIYTFFFADLYQMPSAVAVEVRAYLVSSHNVELAMMSSSSSFHQAIASTPSAPRPSGAATSGSTAPECLHLLRKSQA
jgi:hypothetical protein